MKKKYPEPFRRKKENGAVYYFVAPDEAGKRRNFSTGETQKERARAFIRDFMDKSRSSTSVLTFRQYAEPYFIWEEGKSPLCPHAARLVEEKKVIGRQHCLASRRLLEKWIFTDPIFPTLKITEIRRAHVIDLRGRLLARGKINTAGKAIEAVKTILAEAEFREDIDWNPGTRVSKPKGIPRVRGSFTIEEIRAILAERPGRMGDDPRIGSAFITMFTLGVRCGELRALRWRHLDLEKRSGTVEEATKGESGTETGKPKWEKVRKIALPRLLVEELKAWKKISEHTGPDDFIFCDDDGKGLTQQVIKDSFQSMLDQATTAEGEKEPLLKIEGRWLTPHSTRHTLNSLLLASGVSPLNVAEFLGWSSEIGRAISAVQKNYTHLELVDLMKVADMIDELFTPKKQPERILHLA